MAEKIRINDEKDKTPERESFSVRHLDKEYSADYRRWRRENKNTYGFFYRGAQNEYTYQQGRGFIRDIPEYRELTALTKVNNLISRTLFFYLIICTLVENTLPQFLSEHFGVNIGIDFVNRSLYGDDLTITIYSIIVTTVSRLIPLIVIALATKMTPKIMFPFKISNKPLFGAAIPAALLVAAAGSVMIIPSKNFFAYINADINMNSMPVTDHTAVVLLILFYVIVKPILSEFVIRGAFMQLLRQFGDGYALIVTSIITAVNSEDLRVTLYYLTFSAVIGYFALRTGSVITAVLMRSCINSYFIIQSLLISSGSIPSNFSVMNAFLILVCAAVGVAGVVHFIIKYNHKISLPLNDTYLSNYEKIMTFFTAPSVITWLCSAAAIMITGIPLDL